MGKIKISISWTFWIFVGVLVYFNKSILLVNYMLVLFIHEYAHAFVAYKLGYKIAHIKVIPFGISLNMSTTKFNPKDQILIAIAGPMSNAICVIILVAMWWIVPITYNYTNLFCFAHLSTAMLNLLPCYPLDGGRVFSSIVGSKVSQQKTIKLCKIINVVVATVLFGLFVLSLFYEMNITFLLFGVFVLSNNFIKNKSYSYDFLQYDNKFAKKSSCVIKKIAVDSTLPIYKLCSFVTYNSLIQFVVVDNGRVLFSFYETELNKIYLKYSPTIPIGQIRA